jgi:nucleotide-binding universal stress UspA family protein
MMTIRKILCATDLSENSKVGVAYAVSLARESRAELVFFYVAPNPFYQLPYGRELDLILARDGIPRFTIGEWLEHARLELKRFIHSNFGSETGNVTCTLRVGLGRITDEIVATACQEEADLVVMAKRKRGFARRLFSRSISEAVSRRAPCPVLSICPLQIIRPWREGRAPVGGGILRGSEA